MTWEERVVELSSITRLEEAAAREGAKYGATLLERLPGTWRRMMRSDPSYRSYGTLKFLIEQARTKFETAPTTAHQITSAVIDFVEAAQGPSRIHEIGLRGLAWKEHANACETVGDLRGALNAAERAIEIYGESPALLFDQARARLVLCWVLREMGDAEKALTLARECAEVFHDHGNLAFANMARLAEGAVLFALKQFPEALTTFTNVMEQAERDGDKETVAKCLQNTAECARELGDLKSARDLYPRALALLQEMNMPANCARVRWGYALSLAAEGKVARAVFELFAVRTIYLSLGMNSHAASAALDVVRIKFEIGEDVRDLCTELVPALAEAGLTQNAIEALAYLREQAKGGRLTRDKITRVRTYFDELTARPKQLFAPPRDEEDG